jgi:hypothetical protein
MRAHTHASLSSLLLPTPRPFFFCDRHLSLRLGGRSVQERIGTDMQTRGAIPHTPPPLACVLGRRASTLGRGAQPCEREMALRPCAAAVRAARLYV